MNAREELQAYLNRSTVGFGKNSMHILSITVSNYATGYSHEQV